jgi:parallel beta-helix repeat protein
MERRLLLILFLTALLGMFSVTWAWVPDNAAHQQSGANNLTVGSSYRDYTTMDNPDYYYAAVKTAPSGVTYRQAGFNPNRDRIVAQRQYTDGAITRREVVLMNADGSDEIYISPGDSGEGDIYGYMNPFWSDDGTVVGYAEVHNASWNKIIAYNVASQTSSYIYEPADSDVANPDFLGNSTTAIVFWAYGPVGGADLFTWDGATLTNITNTPDYKEYEPNSNEDGTVILYWSGETTTEPINNTHTLTYSAGSWVVDMGFTPIADTYWSFWSGQSNNNIGVVTGCNTLGYGGTLDIHIYDQTGTYLYDLTGPGYTGATGQWNFIGFNYEGNNGEILFTSNAGRTEAGRDIIIANVRNRVFVDDALGSDLYPGTVNAPFKTIGKGVAVASAGATVNIAVGTYEENVVVTRRMTLQGSGQNDTVISVTSGNALLMAAGTSAGERSYLKDLQVTGGASGIIVGSYTTLENVSSWGNTSYGINLNPLTDLVINNCYFNNNGSGLKLASTASAYNITITGSHFDNNLQHGWYADASSSVEPDLDGVNISYTTFSNNPMKGFYTERLSNAIFDHVVVDNTGSTSYDWGAGIDINLKWKSYSNITIQNSEITNCGIGALNGVGACIKARDDGGTYGANPASLSNVMLDNVQFTGNKNGLNFGEPGRDNAGPTSLTIQNCVFNNVVMDLNNFCQSNVDALTGNTFTGAIDNYAIEDRVYHKLDNEVKGLVTWIDDEVFVTQNSGSIQRGINSASTDWIINVSAGTYQEQLHITTEDLSIVGSGKATTTILCPDVLSLSFGSNPNKPIVFVDGVDEFSLSQLTVDGNGKGNANSRFQGIGFWNAGGTVDNVDVLRIQDTPFSGAQHGVGVYAYNDTDGPYTITCSNMVIDDYQKNAMALMGVGLTIDLDNITTIGAGPTTVTAQNGIQTGYGAGGTIDDCDISGNIYTGDSWSSAGILGWQGLPIIVTDTDIYDNYVNVDMNDNSLSMSGGSVYNTDPDAWDGIYFRNPAIRSGDDGNGRIIPQPQPLSEDYSPAYGRTNFELDMNGVDVTGCDKADAWGIYIRAYGNTQVASITDCEVTGWDLGIYTREAGGTVDCEATSNQIYDNLSYGFYSNTVLPQLATLNWWGDATGPYHATTNTEGFGNAVSDNVEYDPWWGDEAEQELESEEYIVNQNKNTYYTTIQAAINDASTGREGDLIEVPAGTYVEDIHIDRALVMRGEDAETTIISGPIGGNLQTAMIDYSNVTFENFTVTREGNNTTDWNNSGTNQTGLQITQQKTGCLVQNCIFTGNRNALYFNDCQGNTIINNLITNNRTGIQLVNNVSDFVIEDNTITDNWTMGILFYYSGVLTPTTGINIEDNEISGNWYSQIECKTVGANPTTSYDCTPNWFGMASPYAVTSLAGEPGYAAQIPVEFGGTAVNPGGNEGKVSGDLSALVLFNPWWINEEMTILNTDVDLYVDAAELLIQDSESQNYAVKISNITNLRGFEIYISYPDAYFGAASNFLIGEAFEDAADEAPDGGMTLIYPELVSAGNYKVTGSFLGGIPEGGHGVYGTDVTLFTFDLAALADVDNVALAPTYSVVDLGNVVLKDIMNPYHEIGYDETTGFTVIIDATEPTMDALTETPGETLAIDPAKTVANGFASVVNTYLGLSFEDNYNLDYLKFKIQPNADADPDDPSDFSLEIAVDIADLEWVDGAWQIPDNLLNAAANDLPTGDYEIWFLAVDDAGNFDFWSWNFLIDKSAAEPAAWTLCRTTPKQDNSIDLAWTNPGDAVMNHIWYLDYASLPDATGYPEYGPASDYTIPAAPNPYSDDPQNGWTKGPEIAAAGTYTWTGMDRGYYYLTVFVEDINGNLSAAPVAPFYRESISYWPGDVAGTADGIAHTVTSLDIAQLSANWGLTPGNNIVDVGPTVDNGRRSRPEPDNLINIEDLMIFAMNYNNTVYTFYPRTDGEPRTPIRIEAQIAYSGDLLNLSFVLGDNEGFLRGLNIPLSYGSDLSLDSVALGDIWPEGSLLLYTDKENLLTLSLSTLGESALEGNGVIATASFKIDGNDIATELHRMLARDLDNGNIQILNNPTDLVTDNDDMVNVIPVASYLADCYPNPFNPTTTVRYGLKDAGSVRINVYNSRGQLVRSLVNDAKAAGTYSAVWNGLDNSGRPVSSGLYFIRMEARNLVQTKKALLMK